MNCFCSALNRRGPCRAAELELDSELELTPIELLLLGIELVLRGIELVELFLELCIVLFLALVELAFRRF